VSRWYTRQFGNTGELAIDIAFLADPHPAPGLPPERVRSWGTIQVWTRGTCLTRSADTDGTRADGVTWYLFPLLDWLARQARRLVNESAFPVPVAREEVRDAAAWLDISSEPPLAEDERDEDLWFARRSDWEHRHVLGHAFDDSAFPMVVMRRVGDDIEVSWDNEAWPSSRPDRRFTEARGTAYVEASVAARVLTDALADAAAALSSRSVGPRLDPLLRRVRELGRARPEWRWLVSDDTGRQVRKQFPALAARLDDEMVSAPSGVWAPHSVETRLLAGLQGSRAEDLRALVGLSRSAERGGWADRLRELRRAKAPEPIRPWRSGQEAAIELRDRLGWGDGPMPDLARWMRDLGVSAKEVPLGPQVDLAVVAPPERRPTVAVNPSGPHPRRSEMALGTALGHLLMDHDPVAVDGRWEHWPTAARARAFSAMLAMPEEGVRATLRRSGGATERGVRAVMDRYGTGSLATTWHLYNLGMVDADQRVQLAIEVGK